MDDKPIRLVLSFKQSEKWIYDEICRHSGKGNWVKDVLCEKITTERQEQKIQGHKSVSVIDEIL
ncbi:MAG: hypothetical protein RSD74_02220 [Angelakisella sp.]